MTPHRTASLCVLGTTITVSVLLSSSAGLLAGPQTPAKVPTVSPATLQPLLPEAIEGWTKGRANSDRIVATESCTYAFADVVYTSSDMKVRITLADTGFDADALMVLATLVATFPANHTELVPPDTTIARVTYKDAPAATLWNASKGEGEFVVVAGGRFVAKAEGTRLDRPDVLRSAIDLIDFKKLAQLAR